MVSEKVSVKLSNHIIYIYIYYIYSYIWINIYTPTILLNAMKENLYGVMTVHTRQSRARTRQPGSSDDQAGISIVSKILIEKHQRSAVC